MLKKQASKFHKLDDRGAAMIVVTCVMMIVSILALTLLMAAYQMFATVNDEGRDALNYQQAMSFSEVLKSRLVTAPDKRATLHDELVEHIDDFVKDTTEGYDKTILEGKTTGDVNDITLTLDKAEVKGCLVITTTLYDGAKVVSTVRSKYKAKDEGSGVVYKFYEYY